MSGILSTPKPPPLSAPAPMPTPDDEDTRAAEQKKRWQLRNVRGGNLLFLQITAIILAAELVAGN